MIVCNFSQNRMLEDYQCLYAELAGRPRKEPKETGAWMDLALFAVLFRRNSKEALTVLERFTTNTVPLEPYFLRHPIGTAAVSAALLACPVLVHAGYRALVVGMCKCLRASRIVSPLLDAAEKL